MAVCIQYSRPSSGEGQSEVFGLDVAVTNFLSAYFRHGTQDKFICRPINLESFEHFKSLAAAAGHDAEAKCVGLDPRHPRHNLEGISCLFRPDPLIVDLTWRRQQLAGRGYATCGLVHTMSGNRIAQAVEELCLAPSDGADALICPSPAIRDVVQNVWGIYTEYLNHKFGSTYRCPVQTPVIPLGVDTSKFVRLTSADKRKAQRQALNAADDEIVILFVGRLSFATKAHPLALWQAAERAAQGSKCKIRVVMLGYFKPKDMEPHFRGLAADVCKNVTVEFVMNDDARFPDGLWAGADIFASLSDNIQESFGLTPVEAMAAGLPVIASDWDGYRGSVRDGIDGFLVPTIMPPVSAGMAVAEAYYNQENYGVSLMGAAQSTAIDIERCASAIEILASDDAKRRSFGDSGRTRAQEVFDWRHIIKAYEDLWHDLGQKRQTGAGKKALPANWQAVHPSHINPFRMFDSFPSRVMKLEDKIRIVMSKDGIATIAKHEMNYFLPELLLPKEQMLELIEVLRGVGAPRVQDIMTGFDAHQHDMIWRCLGWMLKHGAAVIEK